jgi:hypothetical protein
MFNRVNRLNRLQNKPHNYELHIHTKHRFTLKLGETSFKNKKKASKNKNWKKQDLRDAVFQLS